MMAKGINIIYSFIEDILRAMKRALLSITQNTVGMRLLSVFFRVVSDLGNSIG